jgi:CheY-like chemotaxis protein
VHILFIDDHVDSADAFAEIASRMGHDVEVAYDGNTAMALTHARHFDAVFFDIALPDADGRELCKQMRASGPSRHACIIAVTGMSDIDESELEAFDGLLIKPISVEALARTLKSAEG